jgi:predicted nucleotidyltransferase
MTKRIKYHTDDKGHYVWDNYFVGGKQRRSKRRVFLVDGKVVDDTDEWLLANADDIFLHQIERWDLIGQQGLQPEDQATRPPPRKLRLDMFELEAAFESLPTNHQYDDFEADAPYLDLRDGHVITLEGEDDTEDSFKNRELLRLPNSLFEDFHYGELDEFVHSLPDDPIRKQLATAIRGKGAFKRFKGIVIDGGNQEIKHHWRWFQSRRKRELIAEWLLDMNIAAEWTFDIFQAPPLPNKRADLLRAVLDFVSNTRKLPGVLRIALIGSLVTPKAIPKDVDIFVEVSDEMQLEELAKLSRKLLGKTMQTGDGCGADVFLCNPRHEYLGRICSWKICTPGIRKSCHAQNCGSRTYLYDDLQNLRLEPSLIAEPPLELWPEIKIRSEIPDDVRVELVTNL